MLHKLLIFWKFPTCTALLPPARLLIFEIFPFFMIFYYWFLKNSNLHTLITSCTFINFSIFFHFLWFFTNEFWKIPTCTALLPPARLLILEKFPACMIITSCTFIRYSRVWGFFLQRPKFRIVKFLITQFLHPRWKNICS